MRLSIEEISPDSADSLRLLQRAAAGDDSAFGELFGRYRDHLKRFIELRMDVKLPWLRRRRNHLQLPWRLTR